MFSLFLLSKLNTKQIYNKLLTHVKNCISYNTVCAILDNIRNCIANFLKHQYRLKQIGGAPEKHKIIAVDESLILHDNKDAMIWLVGAIDTETKELRLDIIKERNSTNLKIFINNHVESGTYIVHDGWRAYSFLDGEDSVYTHKTFNHRAGNFGQGNYSTSHIEGIWAWIKSEIKFIYQIIPHTHFKLYNREMEYRFIISNLNNNQKEKHFENLLINVYKLNNFNFYDEEELLNFNNYNYLIKLFIK